VALAHVVVQRQVDHLASTGRLPSPASAGFLLWLHREFYRATPDQFRFLTRNDGSRAEVVPGQFRVRPEEDNEVGAHLPPSSGRVQAFMAYFEKRYAMAERRPGALILAMPAAHHRFAFVHPFVDGNGRVGRLMSHAMALKAGIGAGGLWSISRGLARGLKERCEYKRMLAHADTPRQGDRDGRGNLSMKALEEFSEWFLQVCLDQIRFCSTMYDFPGLQDRYHRLIDDMMGASGRHAKKLISSVLRHGELQRMEAGNVTGTSERTGRYALAEAVQMGFLKSGSVRGPVRVAFPLDYRERLFPNLFTDHEIEIPPAAGTQGG
jgi:Fic family protein